MCQNGLVTTSPFAPTDRPRPRRKIARGWIPDQHGAWAMLTIPLVLGIVLGGPTVVHIPLILAWYAGYFAFYATGVWLKSGRKSRYFPPVRAYGIAAGVPAVVLLIMNPAAAMWAVV